MMRYAPPLPTRPSIRAGWIPRGYGGTRRTVGQIKALVRQGAKDFYVRQHAIDVLLKRGVRPKDYLGEIKALFEWVQANVRYTKDPFRIEVLHSPRRMLELRAGDCDDMTSLLGAMLEAIGHPVRLVIVGPDPRRPRLFSHIYLEANHRGRWIPLDATMPHPMGWSPWAPVKTVINLDRRTTMFGEDAELYRIGAPTAPAAAPVSTAGLTGLVDAIRRGGMQPKDPRIKSLWDLLRQRGLLGRSPWLQRVLRHTWQKGLSARPRPKTAWRITRRLRRWGLLPGPAGSAAPVRRFVATRTVTRPVRLAPRPPIRPGVRPGVRR